MSLFVLRDISLHFRCIIIIPLMQHLTTMELGHYKRPNWPNSKQWATHSRTPSRDCEFRSCDVAAPPLSCWPGHTQLAYSAQQWTAPLLYMQRRRLTHWGHPVETDAKHAPRTNDLRTGDPKTNATNRLNTSPIIKAPPPGSDLASRIQYCFDNDVIGWHFMNILGEIVLEDFQWSFK